MSGQICKILPDGHFFSWTYEPRLHISIHTSLKILVLIIQSRMSYLISLHSLLFGKLYVSVFFSLCLCLFCVIFFVFVSLKSSFWKDNSYTIALSEFLNDSPSIEGHKCFWAISGLDGYEWMGMEMSFGAILWTSLFDANNGIQWTSVGSTDINWKPVG